jgi:hypothetical protein
MRNFWLVSFMLFSGLIVAQNTKEIVAKRVEKAPKIDGKKDALWQEAVASGGFYEFEPGDGNPEPEGYETTVKIVYDDAGIYILAEMNDPDPEHIMRIFSLRDQFTLSDMFGVMINPFKAPGNNYFFSVTAGGTQLDGLQLQNETDMSWNAVWNSAVSITDKGWIVEMAIPYSALRFPKKDEQIWGITFIRDITSLRKKLGWTKIDKTKKGDIVQFMGNLRGLKNIKPPLRLSFYPYTSVNFSRYQGKTEKSPAFGMDVKYGLNENFTLDATLIPDFSDVPYDDIVLNLGPFEQFYSENRPFFTEGMQLFNKGNIFYSRRIGAQPIDYYKVYYEKTPTEIIEENPEKSNLINAIKLSGRTESGLGIGILNAVTGKSEAILLDTVTGGTRKILTAPYTNYNVAVVDYAFKKNNSVGLINTHTFRAGAYEDATVTSAFYDLYFMNNTLKFSGKTNLSVLYDSIATPGFHTDFEISKQKNEHTFSFEFYLSDTRYDINDLGFMRNNNYVIYDFAYRYSILKPTKYLNSFNFSVDIGLDHLYKPYGIFRKDLGLNVFLTTKKYLSIGGHFKLISDTKDYYEPRVPGRYYLDPAKMRGYIFISTDYRKKLALDMGFGGHNYLTTCGNGYSFRFSPRIRFNERFKVFYQLRFSQVYNDRGFAGFENGNIIFGNRDNKTLSQKIKAEYFFNIKSALSLSFRHYWAPVHYTGYYKLNENGSLTKISLPGRNDDINFNVWNLDLGYTWEFAPGSQLTLLYRNSIQNTDRQYDLNYSENLDNLFMQPQRHNFIIKAIYYLDYNTVIRKWF